MSAEERRTAGPALNALRDELASALAAAKAALADAALDARLATEWLDVTLPPRPAAQGTIHPVSQVMEEITAIFADLGFAVAEGPQVEDDWHNFDALNIAPEHPPGRPWTPSTWPARRATTARPTSCAPTPPRPDPPHAGARRALPGDRPGRVYRADYDQTHTPMFHQVEGLAIDRDVTMANLKWVLEEFCRAFFEVDGVELKFRASHFPFTEPSAEVDIRCSWSGGQLKIGEGDDWLEILGSGMVHPKVLQAAGVDPAVWQGFAFGLGVDRIAMLKYGIPDLRAFFDSDLRWLRHYGFAPLDVPTLQGGISR
jgi:phenylalanyl-tRNA synthetase alpha chain